MQKWKKKIVVGMLCIVLIGILASCQEPLSEDFQEEEVIQEAEDMVGLINEGNLEEVYENTFNVVMKNSLELEELQENVDYLLDDKGEFQEFERVQVRGVTDRDTGTQYATALVLAAYEDGKVMFTISFDTDMKCSGFFMK